MSTNCAIYAIYKQVTYGVTTVTLCTLVTWPTCESLVGGKKKGKKFQSSIQGTQIQHKHIDMQV